MSTIPATRPIEVITWSPFATWIFKSSTTDCSICRESLVKPCAECITTHTYGDLTCDVSKGNCGHCFHKHCIDKWISTASTCPICSIPINITIKNINTNQQCKRLPKK